jgi:hypothetical protein
MKKHGTNDESDARMGLTHELRALRKGPGLVAWKLEDMNTLRDVVARHLDEEPQALSIEQTYIYLLHVIKELGDGDSAKILRNAYAVGQEDHPGSLTERRANMSVDANVHPDTVKAHENRAISALVSRLMTTENIGTLEKKTKNEPVRTPGISRTVMTQALERTAEEALGGLYELGSHKAEVSRLFGRNRLPYLDASVECIFSASKRGDRWFTYTYRCVFRSVKSVFRVGVVSSSHDSSVLASSGVTDEVIVLDAKVDFEREIAGIISSWRLTVRDTERGTQIPLQFSELSSARRREILSGVWQVNPEECRIIELEVPQRLQENAHVYELKGSMELRMDELYTFWETPSFMYVNTISVDTTKFPNRGAWNFSLKQFLGTSFSATTEHDGNRFVIPTNSWLLPGHGIVIMRRPA